MFIRFVPLLAAPVLLLAGCSSAPTGAPTDSDLLARTREMVERAEELALAADEAVMRRGLANREHDLVDEALVRWLRAVGSDGRFDLERFANLPELPAGANEPKLYAELASFVAEVPAGIELDEGEQVRIARGHAARFPSWSQSQDRRAVLAVALQSLADSLVRDADVGALGVDAVRSAAGIHEVAVQLARQPIIRIHAASGSSRGSRRAAPQDPQQPQQPPVSTPDLELELALDLAVFYYNHRGLTGPDGRGGVGVERFRRLVRDTSRDPATRGQQPGPLSEDAWRVRVGSVGAEQRIHYWGTLGSIFCDDTWLTGPEDRARGVRYLRNAVELAKASGYRRPDLEARLADVLHRTERPVASIEASIGATRDYFETGRDRRGYRVGHLGLDRGYGARADLDDRLCELHELLYPRRGVYIGGTCGYIDGGESAGDFEDEINRRSPAGRDVSLSLDDTDVGYKGFVGYRFANPFAVELAWTGLEGPDTSVFAPTVDANLLGDIGRLHPLAGRGPSLSVLAHPWECGRLSTFAKLGYWYWEADVDVDLGGGNRVRRRPTGFDFVLGAGLQYRLFDRLNLRVEYERYFLDDDGVDMVSAGLQFTF